MSPKLSELLGDGNPPPSQTEEVSKPEPEAPVADMEEEPTVYQAPSDIRYSARVCVHGMVVTLSWSRMSIQDLQGWLKQQDDDVKWDTELFRKQSFGVEKSAPLTMVSICPERKQIEATVDLGDDGLVSVAGYHDTEEEFVSSIKALQPTPAEVARIKAVKGADKVVLSRAGAGIVCHFRESDRNGVKRRNIDRFERGGIASNGGENSST